MALTEAQKNAIRQQLGAQGGTVPAQAGTGLTEQQKNEIRTKLAQTKEPVQPKKSFLEKAGNFVGGDIANTYGGALAAIGVGKQISEEAGQDVASLGSF